MYTKLQWVKKLSLLGRLIDRGIQAVYNSMIIVKSTNSIASAIDLWAWERWGLECHNRSRFALKPQGTGVGREDVRGLGRTWVRDETDGLACRSKRQASSIYTKKQDSGSF